MHSSYTYITETIARKLRKTRKKFSHKGSFGHVKVVAGSEGMIGAAVLTSKAALKAGAGLVTAHIPHNMAMVMHSTAPEIMVEASDSPLDVQSGLETLGYTLAIGPGLGSSELAHNLVSNAIKQSQTPIVIDADALNILSSNPTWLDDLPKNSILTPHPKEFSRLVAAWENETEKLSKLTTFCYDKQCIVVLKGAHTVLCNPEGNLWFNSTGNPGLATAGSGDVLTGIITGLLAQGYLPINAALLGVYLHGLSADLVLEKESVESLTALNIIEFLGRAFNALQR